MGIISDTDPQPILFSSHLGRFAIVTVSRLLNLADLEEQISEQQKSFYRNTLKEILIRQKLLQTLYVKRMILFPVLKMCLKMSRGSCSLLILTENGIIAARDKLGRTPVVIGKKETAMRWRVETCSFPNTGYETEYFLGPER